MNLTTWMKAIVFLIFMTILPISFISCGDDEEEDGVLPNGLFLPTKESRSDGDKRYFYDSMNRIDSIISIDKLDQNSKNKHVDAQKFVYGADGKLLKLTDYVGNLVDGVIVYGNKYVSTFTYQGTTVTQCETEYDGGIVVTPEYISNVYTLDTKNRVTEVSEYWESNTYVARYEYDVKGNISKKIYVSEDNSFNLYNYDDKNGMYKNVASTPLTLYLFYGHFNAVNNRLGTNGTSSIENIEYDKNGYPVKIIDQRGILTIEYIKK